MIPDDFLTKNRKDWWLAQPLNTEDHRLGWRGEHELSSTYFRPGPVRPHGYFSWPRG
jgi:hypothetical protein